MEHPIGAFAAHFDHESDATPWREWPRAHWPGLLDGLPPSLAHYPAAPEFQFDEFFDAMGCVWREKNAEAWQCGRVTFDDESDGSDWLFALLTDGSTDAYAGFAEDCFERTIDHDAVAAVLSGAPLSHGTVASLSSTADFETVAAQARALGCAVQDRPAL
ncbi:hypothetical protein [Streptomyces sp. NPDC001744]|uniref:hypothetical protein n=1 Tax=Streptomyces sp. NPDC001744 TaxID=3364606 RepID=UPI0036C6C9E2